MARYAGACHCGAVQFEIDADFTELTVCDCSLCRKKNAVMGAVHESRFRLISGEDALGLYQWNTRVARHHFCTRCGIYTFHKKRSAPDQYGVNVFCLEGFDPASVPIRRADGKTMTLIVEDRRPDWSGPPLD